MKDNDELYKKKESPKRKDMFSFMKKRQEEEKKKEKPKASVISSEISRNIKNYFASTTVKLKMSAAGYRIDSDGLSSIRTNFSSGNLDLAYGIMEVKLDDLVRNIESHILLKKMYKDFLLSGDCSEIVESLNKYPLFKSKFSLFFKHNLPIDANFLDDKIKRYLEGSFLYYHYLICNYIQIIDEVYYKSPTKSGLLTSLLNVLNDLNDQYHDLHRIIYKDGRKSKSKAPEKDQENSTDSSYGYSEIKMYGVGYDPYLFDYKVEKIMETLKTGNEEDAKSLFLILLNEIVVLWERHLDLKEGYEPFRFNFDGSKLHEQLKYHKNLLCENGNYETENIKLLKLEKRIVSTLYGGIEFFQQSINKLLEMVPKLYSGIEKERIEDILLGIRNSCVRQYEELRHPKLPSNIGKSKK